MTKRNRGVAKNAPEFRNRYKSSKFVRFGLLALFFSTSVAWRINNPAGDIQPNASSSGGGSSGNANVTYPLNGPAGTAAAPTYATGNSSSGLYYDTAHSALACSAGGLEVAYLSGTAATFLEALNAPSAALTGPLVCSAVSANTLNANGLALGGPLTGTTAFFSALNANGVTVNGPVSANGATITGALSATSLSAGGETLTGALSGTAAVFSGNVTVNGNFSAANFNMTGIASNDAAGLQSFYYVDEMIGDHQYVQTNVGAATFAPNYGSPPTSYPPYFGPGSLQGHPGIYKFNTTNANDLAIYMTGALNNQFVYWPTGPAMQFNVIFSTPSALSVPGDSYTLQVGPCTISGNVFTSGYYLSYTDTLNSGKWQVYEYYSAQETPQVAINSNVTPVAAGWNNFQMTLSGQTVTASINGTVLGTGSPYQMAHNQPVPLSLPCLWYKRNSSTSAGTMPVLLDRMEMAILPPMGR